MRKFICKNGKTKTNNGNGGNGNHYGWGNGNSSTGNNGKGNGNNKTGSADSTVTDNNGSAYGNTNNTGGSQNRSGILFPENGKVSSIEQELIDLIRTSGKEKNYELIEYVNDVNRQYTETLMELNENGYLDTAYTYGNERLSADRFEGSSYYYLYEGRGSVSAVTGTDGYFTTSYRYNAYGEMTFGKPQYENVYGYNGESYNPNLDGQYLRARYYHVETADFFTEDSYLGDISEPLSLNRYNYVYSSYLNYVDSSGNRIDDDVLTYRQFTNELNRVQTSKSYQQSLDTLRRSFDYIARKVEQAQGKSVVMTCNISKSAKQAIDKVNWARVTQGSVQTLLAASIVVVGITAVVATGGLAGAAIAGIASGSGVSAVGAAAIGTFMTGSATAVMGTADVLESGTDVFYGLSGNNKESVHLIRDNIQYFRDNPDSYYLLEAMLGSTAGAGTAALTPVIINEPNNRNKVLDNINDDIEHTRVGRWMSRKEYKNMVSTGKVQMSGDNKVHVANPADINAFSKQAPKGSLYVEFDVPSNTISKGGREGWGIINGPGSLLDRSYEKRGLPRITDMPKAVNIEIKGEK